MNYKRMSISRKKTKDYSFDFAVRSFEILVYRGSNTDAGLILTSLIIVRFQCILFDVQTLFHNHSCATFWFGEDQRIVPDCRNELK